MMTRSEITENGVPLEVQEDGQTVWSRQKELENVAAAAAKAAINNASGVSGDAQAAEKAAKQAVREMI